jgi:hypothetical protein
MRFHDNRCGWLKGWQRGRAFSLRLRVVLAAAASWVNRICDAPFAPPRGRRCCDDAGPCAHGETASAVGEVTPQARCGRLSRFRGCFETDRRPISAHASGLIVCRASGLGGDRVAPGEVEQADQICVAAGPARDHRHEGAFRSSKSDHSLTSRRMSGYSA